MLYNILQNVFFYDNSDIKENRVLVDPLTSRSLQLKGRDWQRHQLRQVKCELWQRGKLLSCWPDMWYWKSLIIACVPSSASMDGKKGYRNFQLGVGWKSGLLMSIMSKPPVPQDIRCSRKSDYASMCGINWWDGTTW